MEAAHQASKLRRSGWARVRSTYGCQPTRSQMHKVPLIGALKNIEQMTRENLCQMKEELRNLYMAQDQATNTLREEHQDMMEKLYVLRAFIRS